MSISEPVLEMVKLIESGNASLCLREGVSELVYISFKDFMHPEFWVAPKYQETNQDWMTKPEKQLLCQKVLRKQCLLEEEQKTAQRESWKQRFMEVANES